MALIGQTTPQVRQMPGQVVNTIRVSVVFSDSQLTNGKPLGVSLPAGAFVTSAQCYIDTAFNAGTTNPLTLGVSQASANELLASGDITAGMIGIYTNTRGVGDALAASANVELYAKYVPTGTAATAGKATFVVQFVPNNDQ